jgi:hypothetical protein
MKAWSRFCAYLKVDVMCTDYTVDQMVSFCSAFIAFEIGVRGLSPWSIKQTYLSAISNGFILRGIKNNFDLARRNPTIKFLLRGYIRIFSVMHPADGMKKMAFTIELVKFLEPALVKSDHERRLDPLFMKVASLALNFGIYFLLRKSEFLPGRSAGKFHGGLQCKHVLFFSEGGFPISWDNVHIGAAKYMEIKIPVSKTDQLGSGRLVKHERVSGPNCIVKRFERWALFSRVAFQSTALDFIFWKIGSPPIITDLEVATIMKAIVVYLGWDSKKVCVHSLRYGGATMLAAAGLPQYVIAYFGGWTEGSASLRRYTQIGGRSIGQVSSIMSEGFNKDLEESRIRAHEASSASKR